MTTPKSALGRIRWEQKEFWRNPAAAAFTFAFPLMFLVIFVAINGDAKVSIPGGQVDFPQYYVPAIVAFGIISACYTNLAFSICIRREKGILKRMRGTPLSSTVYLGGLVGSVIVISLVLTLLTTALGLLFYGVTFPGRYLALAVTIAASAFCFSSVGVAVSTFVPNEDAAPAIINFILFPLLFISGTFGTIESGSTLAKIASLFPIRPLILQMVDVFNPYSKGTGILARDIGMLLLWGVIGLVVSVRRFRWDPKN
ncbi:MAG: ABC transporter permease [Actinomycetota bacterium]|nr:ABC transporter permease [Actinomycetota bacterium]